ncbi:hypothetical protein BKA65DRAFT_295544 [Rhexocercosporidium sp. MPI-PUGE-AT-0058]|nr:hypothetical protein BKA65DRAFT_295544 [Rhexocercosporidium sp. MPI-PUGE-AT-0058]
MIDGMKGVNRGLIINAIAPSSTSYTMIAKKVQEDKLAPSIAFKSTQSFSAAEIAPPSPAAMQYLIVGYVPRSVKDQHTCNNEEYEADQPRGTGTIQPSNIIHWEEHAPPILVVTPVAPKEGDTHLKFYALMSPGKNGLCVPHTIEKVRCSFDGSSALW